VVATEVGSRRGMLLVEAPRVETEAGRGEITQRLPHHSPHPTPSFLESNGII